MVLHFADSLSLTPLFIFLQLLEDSGRAAIFYTRYFLLSHAYGCAVSSVNSRAHLLLFQASPTWYFHSNVLKGMSHPPVPKELLFFHKSWFLLLFSKHNSDVYPTCLKLSREPSDLADGNGNGTAAVEGPLAAPQKIYT